MIESYNDLKNAMRDLTIIDNLPHFESLISKAHNDFNNADIVATKVCIPGINDNMKSKVKRELETGEKHTMKEIVSH